MSVWSDMVVSLRADEDWDSFWAEAARAGVEVRNSAKTATATSTTRPAAFSFFRFVFFVMALCAKKPQGPRYKSPGRPELQIVLVAHSYAIFQAGGAVFCYWDVELGGEGGVFFLGES